ncbi:DUF3817 domain-containing protein [Saccharopolyspora rosea]|uniref:DUF3817 domain-containing protein n=1 Tax=Saccharopolyspora rosea TaxID=524884 RepID=A0ABW3G1I7_9PSEU|nr:DUF3817 domain-containing protein [Saccharopolyspora rosea]
MKPGVLNFYRIMAYVTAVLLILLCLAMVFKYGTPAGSAEQLAGNTWTTRIGIAHGWLYMVYLLVALKLTMALRVPLGRMLLVLLAGTIPTGAFFAERKVTRWYRLRQEGRPIVEQASEESRAS